MQHKCARQRTDGRWDYTSGYTPIGYCHEYKDPEEDNKLGIHWPKNQLDAVRANKDKYHSDGHATEEEARNCYKEYLLDQAFRTWKQRSQDKCEICKEWTQNIVEVGFGCGHLFVLCDEHANREVVEILLEIGESWES